MHIPKFSFLISPPNFHIISEGKIVEKIQKLYKNESVCGKGSDV